MNASELQIKQATAVMALTISVAQTAARILASGAEITEAEAYNMSERLHNNAAAFADEAAKKAGL